MGDNSFGRLAQVAMVVKDIEKARALWAALLGVEEPPVLKNKDWPQMTYRDKPSKGWAKLCFFELENIGLELIQPIGGETTWQNFSEKYGDGIHHVAFKVENLEAALARFKKMGIEVEHKGKIRDEKGGWYVYMDSKDKFGAIIEFLPSNT